MAAEAPQALVPASSDAAEAATSSKRRRVTASKQSAVIEVLEEDIKNHDRDERIATLVEQLKQDASLLAACRGIAKKKKKESELEPLPRGVRTIKDLSNFLVKEILSQLSGVDLAVFANWQAKDNLTLLVWALGGAPKYRLPKLRMSVLELKGWVAKLYSETPLVLKAVPWNRPFTTLDWQLGAVNFVHPNDFKSMNEEALVTELVRVRDNTKTLLPVAWQPKVHEVGTIFKLSNNYNCEECILENAKYESTLKVKTLFPRAEGSPTAVSSGRGTSAASSVPAPTASFQVVVVESKQQDVVPEEPEKSEANEDLEREEEKSDLASELEAAAAAASVTNQWAPSAAGVALPAPQQKL